MFVLKRDISKQTKPSFFGENEFSSNSLNGLSSSIPYTNKYEQASFPMYMQRFLYYICFFPLTFFVWIVSVYLFFLGNHSAAPGLKKNDRLLIQVDKQPASNVD